MTIPLLPDGTPDYDAIARVWPDHEPIVHDASVPWSTAKLEEAVRRQGTLEDERNMIEHGRRQGSNPYAGISAGLDMSIPLGATPRRRRRLADNDLYVGMACGAALTLAFVLLLMIGVMLWDG